MIRSVTLISLLFIVTVTACATPGAEIPLATPTPSPSTADLAVPIRSTASPSSYHTPTPSSPPDTTFLVDLQPPIGRVLWFRPDGLWLVEPETETLQRVVREASAAAWSPDGNRLALLGPPPPGAAAENASFLVPTVIDLLTREAHTFRRVHLSPGGGLVWQNVAGTVYLYGVSADEPACLVRLDPDQGTALLDVCVDQDGATRFGGDIVTLPDGRLAHVVLSRGDQTTGGEAILRLVDPMTGEAETSPLFKHADWRPGHRPDTLRVPMALSPDGQVLAILIGPDVDPHASLSDQQGLYLFDLDARKLRRTLKWEGLRWAAWPRDFSTDTDRQRLAISSLTDERSELFIYERGVDRVRRISPFLQGLFSSSSLSGIGPDVAAPLTWGADGRLLLGVNPQSHDPDAAHPRMAWVTPSPIEITLAGPYAKGLDDWLSYTVEDAALTVHYPPDWRVREWPGDEQSVVARSVSFIPARYTASDQPQVPEIGLAVFRPPLTDTLRAWLDTHNTSAPFGSQAAPQVHFFGVRDVVEVAANGLPAFRFTHDVFGFKAHELLLVNGNTIVGLGYVDFGAEDLGATFLHMRESLSPEAIDPPAGLAYRTEEGLWRVQADGQSVLLVDRPDAVLSPDHTHAVYAEDGDVWLIDVRTGERRNLTETSARIAMFPRWWPARPDTILFSSWPKDGWGPSTGYMTVVRTDGSGYHVLEEQQVSYGLPAPSPDGQLIAYDREGTPWLYRQGVGPESLDPARYGLRRQGMLRIASPAWSPDGKQLAWVVGNYSDGEEVMGIGVFDLVKQTVQFLHPHDPLGFGGWPPAPVWSPDGAWLAYHVLSDDFVKSGVWVLRADGSDEQFLGSGSGPVWSPGGRWLAFTYTTPNGESAIRLAEVGAWRLRHVILPEDAALVDWITR